MRRLRLAHAPPRRLRRPRAPLGVQRHAATTVTTARVIGGGPAGLMAAETLARAGATVTVHERMPSPGRKFLLAGHGGLNLTHSEHRARFVTRYGRSADRIAPMLDAFGPDDLRAWCADLGEATFVGSSGRVFPQAFRATPLFRAWLARLDELGVRIERRTFWSGWSDAGALLVHRRRRPGHRSHGRRHDLRPGWGVVAAPGRGRQLDRALHRARRAGDAAQGGQRRRRGGLVGRLRRALRRKAAQERGRRGARPGLPARARRRDAHPLRDRGRAGLRERRGHSGSPRRRAPDAHGPRRPGGRPPP